MQATRIVLNEKEIIFQHLNKYVVFSVFMKLRHFF